VILLAEPHIENWLAKRHPGNVGTPPVAWLRMIEAPGAVEL
jgi:hypothetical protein